MRITSSRDVLLMLTTFATIACSGNPAAPTPTEWAPSGQSEAKPGGSTSSAFVMTLGPVVSPQDVLNPGHLAGSANLTGTVTGQSVDGDLMVQATGVVSGLSITGATGLSAPGNACTAAEQQALQDFGLTGPSSSIGGDIALLIDQAGRKPSREPELHILLTNVQDQTGRSWNITFSHSMGYRPLLDGDAFGLTAIQETGMIVFSRKGRGSNKTDLSIFCRTDGVVTLSPAS